MGLEEWLASTSERPGNPARPLVTVSYAQSLDGSIAAKRGEPYPLSGAQALELTHRLRAAHDAIMVGIGTVLSDDPQLNVRLVEGNDPQIVVLDSKLRFPKGAKMLDSGKPPIVFCNSPAKSGEEARPKKIQVEQQTGSERVELSLALNRLSELGIRSLMVEGGGEVIASFLDEQLADRAVITIAPVLLNGYRIPESRQHRLKVAGSAQYGNDLVMWGEFANEAN